MYLKHVTRRRTAVGQRGATNLTEFYTWTSWKYDKNVVILRNEIVNTFNKKMVVIRHKYTFNRY